MKSKAKSKGQAAMEFLMTYGWAILIVIAVVAALYASGVFKLGGGGLGKCSPCFPSGSGVTYVDHTSTAVVLQGGPAIRSVSVSVGGVTVATNSTAVDSGSSILVPATSGAPFAGTVNIVVTYVTTDSGLSHNVTATLHGES
jgi:hypothetical protein